jgi:hypothetical protein
MAAGGLILARPPANPFRSLAPGLELGTFSADALSPSGMGTVTILRADPARWEFKLLAQSAGDAPGNLSVAEWAHRHKLTVAVNAGMYDIDYVSHIGYMKSGSHINRKLPNSYQSALAFGPLHDTLPPFFIYDLDVDSLKTLPPKYTHVVQNLRLIKRSRDNRWTRQQKQWSEVALGQDDQGRALFIFSRAPWTMYDLNEFLLSLPIGIVTAQHLEGGSEAQMHVQTADTTFTLIGGYATNSAGSRRGWSGWPIPNVLGLVPRAQPASTTPKRP